MLFPRRDGYPGRPLPCLDGSRFRASLPRRKAHGARLARPRVFPAWPMEGREDKPVTPQMGAALHPKVGGSGQPRGCGTQGRAAQWIRNKDPPWRGVSRGIGRSSARDYFWLESGVLNRRLFKQAEPIIRRSDFFAANPAGRRAGQSPRRRPPSQHDRPIDKRPRRSRAPAARRVPPTRCDRSGGVICCRCLPSPFQASPRRPCLQPRGSARRRSSR